MDKTVQPEDYKYFIEKPDPNFSPARNKAIINQTIKSTEEYFRKIGKVLDDNVLDRIDILSSYGDYRLNRSGTKNFKDYVGKQVYGNLVGERILQKIRMLEQANRLTGRKDRMIQL